MRCFSPTETTWAVPLGALIGTLGFDDTRLRQISRHRRCPKSKGGTECKNRRRQHVRAHWTCLLMVIEYSGGPACWVAGNRRVAVERKELSAARHSRRVRSFTPVPASASMKNDARIWQVVVEQPIVAGIPLTGSLPIVLPIRPLPDWAPICSSARQPSIALIAW
jgi:hypothetical protein